MLAESVIRIGRPIKNSNLSSRERIRLLTDVSFQNCKNYFQHVFLIELNERQSSFEVLQLGNPIKENNKQDFIVDQMRNTSFPIFYPQGGNPLHAQGIYPLPCYLMYDPHIKVMPNKDKFKNEVLLPRLHKTIGYQDMEEKIIENIANEVAELLSQNSLSFLKEEKQLGILMVYDEAIPAFQRKNSRITDDEHLWIASSNQKGEHLYLVGKEVLARINQGKFQEAAELGMEEDAISTFTNKKTDKVTSIYNKSWLWLSPTWDMPCSIHWKTDEWTKGIKVDMESYESYLYGSQFLKELQVPVSNSVLKEMFAPINSAEAKKNIRPSSYEQIYGIPLVLPLVDGDSEQLFDKYKGMLKKEKLSNNDLHLEVLAGIKNRIVPESSDEHRLNILYYSGDLSRGNMHIRAVIEDVIPSVASTIQNILRKLKSVELEKIQQVFQLEYKQVYRTENLPSLLGNAFGAGYLWEVLQKTLHREPLRIDRLLAATAQKLNELANKEEYWQMKHELVFYYSFMYFLKEYQLSILLTKREVKELADWDEFIELYHQGQIKDTDLDSVEQLGFASGLLLKQFSNSYYQKVGKDYVKHRVMKFGSKLTPEMIWKNGLLRCEELAGQWELKIAANFRPVLASTLLGFLDMKDNKLTTEKDIFMTAFWSGYLIYKKNKEEEEILNEN